MNKEKRRSFLGRLRIAFVIVILIPVLSLGGFIFYSSYKYVRDQRMTESSNLVKQSRAALDSWAEQCESSLRYLAGNYTLQEFLKMDENRYIEVNQALKNVGPVLYNVVLTNQYYKKVSVYSDKPFYIDTSLIKNSEEISGESWYQELLETSDIYWWEQDGSMFIGRQIATSYPVKTLGVVVAELEREPFENSFQMFQQTPVRIELRDGGDVIFQYSSAKLGHNAEDREVRWGFEDSRALAHTGWEISYKIDQRYYSQNAIVSLWMPMAVICAVLLAVWFCIHLLSGFLTRDLSALVDEVNKVQDGNFDAVIPHSDIREINILAESMQSMLNKIKQLIRQVYTKEIERQELELNLLQSKISPHFLYNNLSAINWLAIECGEERISEITTEMASFYRTALNKGNNIDRLSVEVTNIKAYMNLQLIAHEQEFDAEYEIEEELLDCIVPIFILQPLVENAIEHGIDQLSEGKGRIRVSIRQEEGWMYLEVFDNGKTLYEQIGSAVLPIENYGYGTQNVHKRIQLLYGAQCGLTIRADESGTVSVIKLNMRDLSN